MTGGTFQGRQSSNTTPVTDIERRRFLLGAAAAGAVASAGCLGIFDDDDNGVIGGNGGVPDDADEQVNDYLKAHDANLYDGTIEDRTGQEEVRISVGADGGQAYDPPAVRVDSETRIVWEWTGDGGTHDVIAADESDLEVFSQQHSAPASTFEREYEDSGILLYYCQIHENDGMHGAVIVD